MILIFRNAISNRGKFKFAQEDIYIYSDKSLYISREKRRESFVFFLLHGSSVRGKRRNEEMFRKYWLISYAL